MNYETFFVGQLRRQRDEGRYRVFAELDRIVGAFPRARLHRDGQTPREVTVWCSTDYLAMGQHPTLTTAMHNAIDARGLGTSGSRNISGTSTLHAKLERELATLHAKEAALLFSSGYVTKDTTLQPWVVCCPAVNFIPTRATIGCGELKIIMSCCMPVLALEDMTFLF